MNILHASSEVFPYSKTGGLADATAALAKSQAAAGPCNLTQPWLHRRNFETWGDTSLWRPRTEAVNVMANAE